MNSCKYDAIKYQLDISYQTVVRLSDSIDRLTLAGVFVDGRECMSQSVLNIVKRLQNEHIDHA